MFLTWLHATFCLPHCVTCGWAGVGSWETGGVSNTFWASFVGFELTIPTFRTAHEHGSSLAPERVLFDRAGCPVTGPRSCPRGDSCLTASGVAFFWTPRGTEAPRARGLFWWGLVRIKSLPCGPLCPAEVDKHGRSRSETSPRGKKSRAGWEQQQKDLKESRTRDEFNMSLIQTLDKGFDLIILNII